jgi:integrase
MSEHKVVDPEVWAAAQVEAVAVEVEKKAKRRKAKDEPPAKVRGVLFRPRAGGEVIGTKNVRADGRVIRTENVSGEWWALYADGDGRIHREKAGTKAAAVAVYQRRKTEVRQGRLFPESMRRRQVVSVKALCDAYVSNLAINGRDPREQVKTRLAEVVDVLGNIEAKSVRPQDIERLKTKLAESEARGRGRTRTPASVNRYVQDIRAAYNLARRNGLVDKNPVADVRLLRENNKRVREVTAEEEAAILSALEPSERRFHTDLRPLVRLLVDTGLRLGEACNLRWSDIDFRAEVATLRQTKAGKVQHIPLSVEALGILRVLSAQADDLARRNGKVERNPYVFGWPDGRPWTSGYLTHEFHKAAVKAGVADVHAHDMRHTAACRWRRAGVDIYTVSKLLRHASVVMSERYAHLSQADLKAAVNKATSTCTSTSKEAAS